VPVQGAKAGEGLATEAPKTPPAPYGFTAPTARLLLPAGAAAEVWQATRATGVGGSDVAAILGMDAHRGALAVWLEKTGQAPQRRDARLERSARRGHRLESLVAEFFAEETGLTVLDSPGTLQHVDHPHWIANPDRLTVATAGIGRDDVSVLECKSRTWRSARFEGWHGEEAPDRPAIQAHWYLTVTGYRTAYRGHHRAARPSVGCQRRGDGRGRSRRDDAAQAAPPRTPRRDRRAGP
jgi:putative phage-type endonuclease